MRKLFEFMCKEKGFDVEDATREYEDLLKVIVSQVVFINRELSFSKSIDYIFKNKFVLFSNSFGIIGEIVDILYTTTWDFAEPERENPLDKYWNIPNNLSDTMIKEITNVLLLEKDNLKGEDDLPLEYEDWCFSKFIEYNFNKFKNAFYNNFYLNDLFSLLFKRVKKKYLENGLMYQYNDFPWRDFFSSLDCNMPSQDKYNFFFRGIETKDATDVINEVINDIIETEVKSK